MKPPSLVLPRRSFCLICSCLMAPLASCAALHTRCFTAPRNRCQMSMHVRLQLRHPNILSFKETLELEEKGMTVIYVVTEAVTPLADRLHQLDMSGPAR